MKFSRWIGNRQGGFSIVELMVVIAVIAILAATAIPGIINWLPNYRLKSAARDLFSRIQQAKLQAVRLNQECAVVFDVANSRYQLISGGPDRLYGVGGDDVVLMTTPFDGYGSGIRFGSGDATQSVDGLTVFPPETNWDFLLGNFVLFDTRGIVFDPGYVYLRNNDGACFAVGTPTSAGTILLRKWYHVGGWQ